MLVLLERGLDFAEKANIRWEERRKTANRCLSVEKRDEKIQEIGLETAKWSKTRTLYPLRVSLRP